MKLNRTFCFFIASVFSLQVFSQASLIDKTSADLVSKMTLEEKIGMLHSTGTFTSGGVQRLGIPEVRMSDGPVGIRMEIARKDWSILNWTNDDGAYFPAGVALAATWDTSLARSFGVALGQESKIRGKHIQLAPGLNIHRTPLCGRNWEYMSEDPFLTATMVVPEVQGIQSNGVAACIKHFALNNQETERGTIDVQVDERSLREIYLPAFEAAVKAGGALTVMGAYNKFRGQHATYNEYLVEDILRGEWGFKGLVVSDWGATHSTYEAALCGLDIEMGSRTYMADALLSAVNRGKIPMKFIDDKVKNILYVLQNIKALNQPDFDTTGMYAKLATPERVTMIKKISEESIVLLKNTNNFLPLNAKKIKTLAVIGDNATRKHALGGGSTTVEARYEITPLEALQKTYNGKINIKYSPGYEVPNPPAWGRDSSLFKTNEKYIEEAVSIAKSADYVIVFGGLNHNNGNDTEGADKPNMSLPYGQDKLISEILKVNPNTLVVINCGTPVEMGDWLDKVPALLQCGYPGMETGNVLEEVIFGKVNPSGKITYTFPKKLKDSPAHQLNAYPGSRGRVVYREGLLVGYRYFDTKNVEPLFPFGFGLSYTTFEYSKLTLPKDFTSSSNEVEVTFVVKNIGKKAGKEISQVYIRDVESSVERPFKELKGFSKISLKPGESKKVTVKLDKRAFQFYDADKKEWRAEPGKFEIMVGGSSKDIKLKGETTLL